MMKLLIKHMQHVGTHALVLIIVSHIIFMAVGVSLLRGLLCLQPYASLLLMIICSNDLFFSQKLSQYTTKYIHHNFHI